MHAWEGCLGQEHAAKRGDADHKTELDYGRQDAARVRRILRRHLGEGNGDDGARGHTLPEPADERRDWEEQPTRTPVRDVEADEQVANGGEDAAYRDDPLVPGDWQTSPVQARKRETDSERDECEARLECRFA